MNRKAAKTVKISDDIILREIQPSDAPDMFNMLDSQREYLGRWLPFVPLTQKVSDSLEYINYVRSMPVEMNELVFAILVGGEFAGTIGLKDTDNVNLKTEIGYWLGEQHQGRGIITRSVEALCDIAFNELGMNRVQIKCAVGNSRSSNIPKRLGFKFEGIERAGERTADGSFFDIEVYSLLKDEIQTPQE